MKLTHKSLILLLGAAALTACSNDSTQEITFATNSVNLITPVNGTQDDADIERCTYTVRLNYTDGLIDILAPQFEVGDKNITFKALDIRMKDNNVSYLIEDYNSNNITGNAQIQNFQGRIYPPATLNFAEVPSGAVLFNMSYVPALSYTVDGKYEVRSFPSDAFYKGMTTTTGSGQFQSDETVYRVVFSQNCEKANIYVLNAKLAEKMRPINFVLNDLEVEPRNGGYDIVGEDIIPVNFAEGTKYDRFPMKSFKLSTLSSDLTSVSIQYSITMPVGECTATFSGSYLRK